MQQNQNSLTLLEHLPNELFKEILSYFNGVDALITFSSLNKRFQSLVLHYSKLFNFKSISKTKFDLIFEKHDTQQWTSLQLVDDNHTMGQIEYFIQKYSSVKHFNQLQSLSILSIIPLNEYKLFQLPYFENLISLTISAVCGTKMSQINLPKLKQLAVSTCNFDWIKNCSQLESLEYTLGSCCWRQPILIPPSKLKRLKIIYLGNIDLRELHHSFKNLSQLITLEIYQKEAAYTPPNGHEWEQLICSTLPLLKHFKFCFQFKYSLSPTNELDEVVSSFSTSFYTLEKKWFIRCDRKKSNLDRTRAVLYSLPFALDSFTILTKCFDKSISTLPNNENNNLNKNLYPNVKTLIFKQSLVPYEYFNKTNITNLIMENRICFFEWMHILTNLRHLEITFGAKMWSKNFGRLLDNIPNLCSLTVEKKVLQGLTKNWSNAVVCNHLSNKIRSLNLSFRRNKTNTNELHRIVQIFSKNCEHLSINSTVSTETIVFIFRNMRQLQSLHVKICPISYSSISMLWSELEQQQKKFNRSNSIMTKHLNGYYFWLGKYS